MGMCTRGSLASPRYLAVLGSMRIELSILGPSYVPIPRILQGGGHLTRSLIVQLSVGEGSMQSARLWGTGLALGFRVWGLVGNKGRYSQ